MLAWYSDDTDKRGQTVTADSKGEAMKTAQPQRQTADELAARLAARNIAAKHVAAQRLAVAATVAELHS